MSVATEFPPVVYVPERARRRSAVVLPFRPREQVSAAEWDAGSLREAAGEVSRRYPVRPVPVHRRPVATSPSRRVGSAVRVDGRAAPLRLTRRGRVVVVVFGALLAAGLLWIAHASALAAAPAPSAPAPAVVTVQQGDTLWAIASRIAPQSDPRPVVAKLERLNGLTTADVTPGQQLRTR